MGWAYPAHRFGCGRALYTASVFLRKLQSIRGFIGGCTKFCLDRLDDEGTRWRAGYRKTRRRPSAVAS